VRPQALDKVRFMSLTDPATLGEGDTAKLEMKLIADKDAKTLTLIDRGCGAPRARRASRARRADPRQPRRTRRAPTATIRLSP